MGEAPQVGGGDGTRTRFREEGSSLPRENIETRHLRGRFRAGHHPGLVEYPERVSGRRVAVNAQCGVRSFGGTSPAETDAEGAGLTFVHEVSYQGKGLIPHIHRRRLDLLFEVLERLGPLEAGALGDFGCSNGYVLSLLLDRQTLGSEVELHGLDHVQELLDLAKEKTGDAVTYHHIDLNQRNTDWENHFDLVTCLETLEHTGDCRAAFDNLYRSCKPGGAIVVSVPNEKGIPGLLKFFPLKVLRKPGHQDFFRDKSEMEYLKCLVLNQRIDGFRHPPGPAGVRTWASIGARSSRSSTTMSVPASCAGSSRHRISSASTCSTC